jgi:hypothetical protein
MKSYTKKEIRKMESLKKPVKMFKQKMRLKANANSQKTIKTKRRKRSNREIREKRKKEATFLNQTIRINSPQTRQRGHNAKEEK